MPDLPAKPEPAKVEPTKPEPVKPKPVVAEKEPEKKPEPETPAEETPTKENKLLSGSGNWSGAKVASSGCGKCHGRIDWDSKTEKQWQFFFKRRRHRRNAKLEDLFSRGELKRVEQYIISKLTREKQHGIAGVK